MKKTPILLKIFFLLSLFCVASYGFTQPVWQLSKERNGIKVYTKKGDSTSFKSIKVECVLNGSWAKLSSILMNIKLQPQWVFHSKNTYLIKKVANNEVLYYTEMALPWPVANRDAVVRMKLYNDKGVYKVLSTNEPNGLPPKAGKVRVPQYKATWEVKPLPKNKIAIIYVLEVIPGGRVPPWVVNMFVTRGPFETFSKLSGLLKK